jgi:hypothetical protein
VDAAGKTDATPSPSRNGEPQKYLFDSNDDDDSKGKPSDAASRKRPSSTAVDQWSQKKLKISPEPQKLVIQVPTL